jgi:hypothetical protein
MVLLVCLPLTVIKAVGYGALALGRVHPESAALIGFASALAYLAVFFPALLVFEPFAIVASIWYTRRSPYNEPIGRLIVCWLAVMVHTAVLISYLRLGR